MRTFVISYGYPIRMSVVTSSEDGITASAKADEYIKSQGFSLDRVQIFVHPLENNTLTFI